MATLQYGVGNLLNLDSVTHTGDITDAHKQILGVPSNAIISVNGMEGFEGDLPAGSLVTFVTKSNSKAN